MVRYSRSLYLLAVLFSTLALPACSGGEGTDDTAALRVVVEDETGAVVPDAEVSVVQWEYGEDNSGDSQETVAGTTDEQGQVMLRVVAEQALMVRIDTGGIEKGSRSGYDLQERIEPLAKGETRSMRFTVAPIIGQFVHFRIVDADTGAPLEGVGPAERPAGLAHAPTSDAAGMLRVSSGRFHEQAGDVLTLGLPGYTPVRVPLSAARSRAEHALLVPLSRTASLRVQVLDGEQGAPERFAGQTVRLEIDSGLTLWWGEAFGVAGELGQQRDALLDESGTAVFEDAPTRTGFRLLRRTADGDFVSFGEMLRLQPGESRTIDWRVHPETELSGVLVDDQGEACPGVEVWLLETVHVAQPGAGVALLDGMRAGGVTQRTTTDADGRFRFDEVPSRPWWVGVAPTDRAATEVAAPDESPGDTLAAVAVRVQPETTGDFPPVRLEAPRGLGKPGRVVHASGEPVAGIEVLATHGSWGGVLEATTDEDGRFRIAGLVPGRIDLFAMRDRVSSNIVTTHTNARDLPILTLADGVPVRVDYTLTTGVEPSSSSWRLIPMSPDAASWWSQAEDQSDGRVEFASQVPGRYMLRATTGEGTLLCLEPIEVTESGASTFQVELTPKPTAWILLDAPHASQGYEVVARQDGQPVARPPFGAGGVTVMSVPAGELVVEARARFGQETVESSLELAPGEIHLLRLGR